MRDWNKPGNIKDYIGRLNRIRRANPALLQTADLRFVAVDDDRSHRLRQGIRRCMTTRWRWRSRCRRSGPRNFWFHFGDLEIGPDGARRRVAAVENLVTGERHTIEWGGVRLRIDPAHDPALLFRCSDVSK